MEQHDGEMDYSDIQRILGERAEFLLEHRCRTIAKENLHLPGGDWVDRILSPSDRPISVLKNMQAILFHGRLKGTGYLSILPVDQGVEHSAGASFSPCPDYFDPENIVKLAIEGGCNAVASTLGVLGSVARKYAHKIPLILKINHNEWLSYPNAYDQVLFASIEQAHDMGCCGVGATVYWGAPESKQRLVEVARAFELAHQYGMVTFLWCYLRNSHFKEDGQDFHCAADLTGQANYLGATVKADIVKQKLPMNNEGFKQLNFGKYEERMYSQLSSNHPIDLTRYQLINSYGGRVGLISSGGPSGKKDLEDAVETAVINKRAGGMGLISGRKAFQKPMKEGVKILHAVQDVFLCNGVTIA